MSPVHSKMKELLVRTIGVSLSRSCNYQSSKLEARSLPQISVVDDSFMHRQGTLSSSPLTICKEKVIHAG